MDLLDSKGKVGKFDMKQCILAWENPFVYYMGDGLVLMMPLNLRSRFVNRNG